MFSGLTDHDYREATADNFREAGVSPVFAVESGSRAWGMPSLTSDYDVRVVYARPAWNYFRGRLSRRDETERFASTLDTVKDPIDVEGWAAVKFTELALNFNPTAFEWLRSPIVYDGYDERSELLDALDPGVTLRWRFARSYIGLALNKQPTRVMGAEATTKSMLYALRGAMSAVVLAESGEWPSLDVSELAERFEPWTYDLVRKLVLLRADQREDARAYCGPEFGANLNELLRRAREAISAREAEPSVADQRDREAIARLALSLSLEAGS